MDEIKIWFFLGLCVFFISCILIYYTPIIYIYFLKKVYKHVSWLLRSKNNTVEAIEVTEGNIKISEEDAKKELQKKREYIRNRKRSKKFNKNITRIVVFVASLVLFIAFISVVFSYMIPSMQGAEGGNVYTGPLGDLFNGLLTPLLTFLTFCGLLVTIMMQNLQMKATLQELELTRKEMADSTTALEAQVKSSTAQKFDSNFYSMLQLHMSVSEILKSKKTVIADEFKKFEKENHKWNSFQHPDDLRSFFLINYQMLKFIKNNEDCEILSYEQAKQYANILRSMLDDDLFGLIFLNCSNVRFEKYKKLIEYYQFLEHFVFSEIKSTYLLKIIGNYDRNVFGDSENFNDSLELKCSLFRNSIVKVTVQNINLIQCCFDEDNEFARFNYPLMDYFAQQNPLEYGIAKNIANKIELMKVEVVGLVKNASVIDFLSDDLVGDLSCGKYYRVLTKFGFNVWNYMQLLEKIKFYVDRYKIPYFKTINDEIIEIKDQLGGKE